MIVMDIHPVDSFSFSDKCQWRTFVTSVRGSSHERSGLPNQDSAEFWPETSDPHSRTILAIADGHGSAKCCRSNLGSEFAVLEALETCRLLAECNEPDLTPIKRQIEEYALAKNLVRNWRERVEQHYADNPFSDEELVRMEITDHTQGINPWSAYGATLLVAVVTERFVLYMQLGDGDIVVVDGNGVVKRPLESDSRLIANETTSLSGKEQPWFDFRVSFQTLEGSPPALILLATDGYANSFQDDTGFLKVSSDTMNMILEHGFEVVADSMEGWLEDITKEGSGDDISVGIAFRSTPRPKAAITPQRNEESIITIEAVSTVGEAEEEGIALTTPSDSGVMSSVADENDGQTPSEETMESDSATHPFGSDPESDKENKRNLL